MIKHPEWTLDEMIRSREYDDYIGDKLGNMLYLDDPDRADRRDKASENGAEGSTHAEIIQDWRDFLATLSEFDPEFHDQEDLENHDFDITKEQGEAIGKEIDDCEEWHRNNGSLDQEIG